jgi:hypothetical protein
MLLRKFQLFDSNRLTNHIVRNLQRLRGHYVENIVPGFLLGRIAFAADERQKVIVNIERFALEFREELQKFFISKLKQPLSDSKSDSKSDNSEDYICNNKKNICKLMKYSSNSNDESCNNTESYNNSDVSSDSQSSIEHKKDILTSSSSYVFDKDQFKQKFLKMFLKTFPLKQNKKILLLTPSALSCWICATFGWVT